MLIATCDEATGIVTTVSHGLSSTADFDAYFSVLQRCLDRSLARHGKWLHLVDALESPVQCKDEANHINDRWNANARGDGYTAYVLHSMLVKMQIQRMIETDRRRFFGDLPSARSWLLEQISAPSASASH